MVFYVATKFLEAESAIRSAEKFNASIVSIVLDTLEDKPTGIDAP